MADLHCSNELFAVAERLKGSITAVIMRRGTLWSGEWSQFFEGIKRYFKVILSVVGAAALLASPAMAKQMHPARVLTVPSDARASVAPYGVNEGGPYTASVPTSRYNTNRDFQNGSRG
jgi:hypothetical protein